MQAEAPLVTVVVPAWNAQATIDETLRSVAAQTYRNLEIIIVDDGSTDRTAEVAADFCSREPRARLIAKDNGGVASARNRGIEAAGGKWIAPIDADDLWHPTKIEKQVRAALAAPQTPGFVYCWYQSIDEQDYVLGSGPRWAIEGPALKQLAYCNPVRNGSALLVSRSAALSVGGYDSSLRALAAEGCEDVMIQLQIARAHPVALVPEHLVGYRQRASSMSSDSAQILRSWRMVYERLRADGADIPVSVLRWIEGFCRISVAADRAASGSHRQALPLLLGALRRDPVRCGFYLLYRSTRTAVRLARGRRPHAARVHFSELDPRTFVQPDADDLTGFASLLTRIEERRLRRLAAMDSAAARSAECRPD